MARKKTRETWDGGYVHTQADGRPLYILEKRVGGRKFHISTRCHIESAAYEHLKRFEANPFRYETEMAGGPPRGAALTAELVMEYRRHMLERQKPATRRHANEMAHRLLEWVEDLGGMDLRLVKPQRLAAVVESRRTCRQHRIIAIKGLATWLRRTKFALDRRSDPTLDLSVPQAEPEKHRRRKAVEAERVKAALGELEPPHDDVLVVLAATGWHVTELARFVRQEDSEIAPGKGGILAVLVTRHKSGGWTRTPITDPSVVRAAKRLKRRGAMPRRLNGHLREACACAKVEPFTLGVMRHSVATWAIERGSLPAEVAAFLNHSERTSKRFYQDAAIPTNVVRLPRFGR